MKKFLLVGLILFSALLGQGQSRTYPWAVGLGVNFPDFKGARSSFGKYLTDVYWEHKGVPIKVTLGYNLNASFNLEASANFCKGDNITELPQLYDNFWDVDLNLQYRFANGYMLKETSWWDPYLLIGPQVSNFNDLTHLTMDAGLGMNFWIVKHIALFGQAAYDVNFDGDDYYHFGFGAKYRFGCGSDRDKDGIKDKKDKCPDVAGLPEFEGCPDTDGDGIPDNLDKCPTVKGPAQLEGCPDSDGDGILDKDDACPTTPGLKEFKGCPDKDGDGIPDKDDKCPDVKGIKSLQGCPDTDGDGIADAEDKCPNEKGPSSNNGCPVPPPAPVSTWSFPDLIIYYNTAKNDVPADYKARLDEAARIMKDHPEAAFTVSGHTDNVGNDNYNLNLSDARAKKVMQYLVKKGAAESKLVAVGYGESTPAATNDTDEGRSKNRRVEVTLKK